MEENVNLETFKRFIGFFVVVVVVGFCFVLLFGYVYVCMG